MDKFRVAVIGGGYMGRRHIDGYRRLMNVEVVGAASATERTAEIIREAYGIPAYTDWRALLDEKTPDAVSVCTPNALHAEMGMETLRRGMHTLVEKPLTRTVDEALALIARAATSDAILMTAHTELYDNAILKMITAVNRGYIGEVRAIECDKLGADVSPGEVEKGRVETGMQDETQHPQYAYDVLIHVVYVLNKIAAAPVKAVYTRELQARMYRPVVEAEINYENGIMARINMNGMLDTPYRKAFRVIGTEGTLQWLLSGDGVTLTMEKQGRKQPVRVEPGSAFDNVTRYFVEFARSGTRPYSDGEDGLLAMETAARILAVRGLSPEDEPSAGTA